MYTKKITNIDICFSIYQNMQHISIFNFQTAISNILVILNLAFLPVIINLDFLKYP